MNPPRDQATENTPPLWSGGQFLFPVGQVVCWEGHSLLLAAPLTRKGDAQALI